jgi:hypothetical protein
MLGYIFRRQCFHMVNCILQFQEGLRIFITDEDGEDTNKTSNVVYKKVFHNIP